MSSSDDTAGDLRSAMKNMHDALNGMTSVEYAIRSCEKDRVKKMGERGYATVLKAVRECQSALHAISERLDPTPSEPEE
jgi:hypothetical protein